MPCLHWDFASFFFGGGGGVLFANVYMCGLNAFLLFVRFCMLCDTIQVRKASITWKTTSWKQAAPRSAPSSRLSKVAAKRKSSSSRKWPAVMQQTLQRSKYVLISKNIHIIKNAGGFKNKIAYTAVLKNVLRTPQPSAPTPVYLCPDIHSFSFVERMTT